VSGLLETAHTSKWGTSPIHGCLMLRQHGPATYTGAASLFFTRLYIFAAALLLAFIGCFLVIPACLMCACTAHSNLPIPPPSPLRPPPRTGASFTALAAIHTITYSCECLVNVALSFLSLHSLLYSVVFRFPPPKNSHAHSGSGRCPGVQRYRKFSRNYPSQELRQFSACFRSPPMHSPFFFPRRPCGGWWADESRKKLTKVLLTGLS